MSTVRVAGITASTASAVVHSTIQVAGITAQTTAHSTIRVAGITALIPSVIPHSTIRVAGVTAATAVPSAMSARAGLDQKDLIGGQVVKLDGRNTTGAWSVADWTQRKTGSEPDIAIDGTGLQQTFVAPYKRGPLPTTYTLMLTVSDGVTNSVDEMTVTVLPWQRWILTAPGVWSPRDTQLIA